MTPKPRSLCTTLLSLIEMPYRTLPSPAARMPSPWAWVTVKPLNRMPELIITTAAKMVCVPKGGGRCTWNAGLTPASSMVALWPSSDTGLFTTTCS